MFVVSTIGDQIEGVCKYFRTAVSAALAKAWPRESGPRCTLGQTSLESLYRLTLLHRAERGCRSPSSLAIAVAVGQAALRIALALGRPGQLADLGLHDRGGQDADALAQQVDVAVGAHLAQGLEQVHAGIGHRGVPPVVGLQLQRREDGAVAASFARPIRSYTKSGDSTV